MDNPHASQQPSTDNEKPIEGTHSFKQDSHVAPTCHGGAGEQGGQAPPEMLGRYRIEGVIGQGASGEVFRATDTGLGRPVAIKVVRQQLNAQVIGDGFLDEARMLAKLDHERIVPIYDFGRTAAGDFYVVSKLIEGANLETALKERQWSPAQSVSMVAAIAGALHHAHERGIVHRDVKPANILVDGDGRAYLTDFGIALGDDKLGKGPDYIGTPIYMSPEQVTASHRLDGRSDIFSLGVVLYELLTGQRPFRSNDDKELRDQICTMEAKPLRQIDDSIPASVEQACLKALSKKPGERYSTAADFQQALNNLMKDAAPRVSFNSIGLAVAAITLLVAIGFGISRRALVERLSQTQMEGMRK